MKFERINDNIVKVTIPVSYFEEKDICIDQFTQNTPALQDFFCELMESIEKRYGFSFTNSFIKIEAELSTNSCEEEIILTLTRTPKNLNDGSLSLLDKYLRRKYENALNNIKTNTPSKQMDTIYKPLSSSKNAGETLICTFKNFDNLCQLAQNIQGSYSNYNSLYMLNSIYYLVYKKDKSQYVNLLFEEFGNVVYDSSFTEGYLNEYGKLAILGNALDVLNRHF